MNALIMATLCLIFEFFASNKTLASSNERKRYINCPGNEAIQPLDDLSSPEAYPPTFPHLGDQSKVESRPLNHTFSLMQTQKV